MSDRRMLELQAGRNMYVIDIRLRLNPASHETFSSRAFHTSTVSGAKVQVNRRTGDRRKVRRRKIELLSKHILACRLEEVLSTFCQMSDAEGLHMPAQLSMAADDRTEMAVVKRTKDAETGVVFLSWLLQDRIVAGNTPTGRVPWQQCRQRLFASRRLSPLGPETVGTGIQGELASLFLSRGYHTGPPSVFGNKIPMVFKAYLRKRAVDPTLRLRGRPGQSLRNLCTEVVTDLISHVIMSRVERMCVCIQPFGSEQNGPIVV